jgi:hypothetical protein
VDIAAGWTRVELCLRGLECQGVASARKQNLDAVMRHFNIEVRGMALKEIRGRGFESAGRSCKKVHQCLVLKICFVCSHFLK